MTLHIGEKVPDFVAETTVGPLSLYDWAGSSWVFFFSHPADFTPVCTTELGRTAQLAHEFESRNVKPLGLSTDTLVKHLSWTRDVNKTQKTKLEFPIIADSDLRIARLYEMIHPDESETESVRTVFVIDPSRTLRLSMAYPINVGRNFSEILRVIDALQLGDKKHVVTPADWQMGDPVLIPSSMSDDQAAEMFPQGWQQILPYLRVTVVKS